MSETQSRTELYDIIEVPLNGNLTDHPITIDADIVVVAQVPIEVTAKINDSANKEFSLALIRRINMKITRLYITTTTTSTDSLILFVSRGIDVETGGYSGRSLLVDASENSYDAREIKTTSVLSAVTQIDDSTDEDTALVSEGNYNKVMVSIVADRILTISLQAKLGGGTTWRTIDSVATVANTPLSIEWSITSATMNINIANASGGNTTVCEREIIMSTGA